ncbi:MAG: hypothetical protein ACXWDO_04500 [Bacteroidia bacterium]
MKIAGILLMIAGVMMLLATILQLPAIFELLKYGSQKAIASKLIYNVLLLSAGFFLVFIGRKVRRSTIS